MGRTAFFASRPATHGRANVQQKNLVLLLLWRHREDVAGLPIGVPRADAAPGLWPMRVAYFTEETPADM
ncbi:hypothetical protein P3T42_003311 [Paraburkholderia sp. GAS38]|jgi:hypothetical protein